MGFPIETRRQEHEPEIAPTSDSEGEARDRFHADVRAREKGKARAADSRSAELSPVQLGTGSCSRWIAVAGGFGYAPVAPGTAGSLAGVGLFLASIFVFLPLGGEVPPGGEVGRESALGAGLAMATFFGLYSLGVLGLLILGIWAAGRAEVDFGRRDDGRIVIDEVVGQLIALAPLLWFLEPGFLEPGHAEFEQIHLFPLFFGVVTGFVLFRLFDIWKPGAIRWAEQHFDGGVGVMADDVVAGVYAAAALCVIQLLFSRTLAETLFATVFGAEALA